MYIFLYQCIQFFRVLPYRTISLILTCLVNEFSPLSMKIRANWMPNAMHVTHKFLSYILRGLNQFWAQGPNDLKCGPGWAKSKWNEEL